MLLFWINPFDEMFNIKSYTKWYHYFRAMPLTVIFFCVCWVAIPVIHMFDHMKSKSKRK
ncbi:hypothetical protein [Paenibacillus taichungensis]